MKIILYFTLLIVSNFAVAEATFIPSDKLFTQPSNYNGQMAPDGKYFSYLIFEKSYQYLLFIDLDTQEFFTALKVPKKTPIKSYSWVSKDHLLVRFLISNTEVDCLVEVSRLMQDGEPYIKSDYTEIDDGYIVDMLFDEPDFVLFSKVTVDSDGQDQTLYKITLEQLKNADFDSAIILEDERDDVFRYVLDNNFDRFIGTFIDEDNESIHFKYRDAKGGDWVKLFTFSEEDSILPIGFIDNQSFAILTNKNADKVGLYSLDIETSKIKKTIYVHDKYDLIGASLTSKGKVLSVKYVENGKPKEEWFESDSQKISHRFNSTFKGDIPVIISSNLTGDRLLIRVHGANNPGKYYLYKKNTDKLLQLLSAYPELDDYDYPEHSVLEIETDDEMTMEAYLTKPKGFDRNTLLVMPHGGPIGTRDYNLFDREVQYLANRGFTVLRVNFRGSDGFGKKFREQGVGEFGKRIESDISLAVKKVLITEKFDHVCAIGTSYGAYSSMMLSLKHPELYECVVASYGVYDLPLLFNYSNLQSGEEFEAYIAKTAGQNSATKKNFSPLYLAKDIKVPVLLIAGKKDKVAGFEQSNRMRYVLEELNKDIEFVLYQNAGHGHSYWYGDQHEFSYIVEFLTKNLKLPPMQVDSLSEEDRKAIAHDYTVIADGFDNESLMINQEVSLEYTRRASEFGEARFTFNLGSFYHRGVIVEKDMTEAIKHYKKAAEQGHLNGYSRLGTIYFKGLDIERNDELAFKYLSLALKKEPSNTNIQLMARFYCNAGEAFKSVDKCIALLREQEKKLESFLQKDRTRLFDDMSLILSDNTFTENEHKVYKQLMVDVMRINEPDFDIDLEYAGFVYYKESYYYGHSGKSIEIELADLPNFSKEIEAKSIWFKLLFRPDHDGLATTNKLSFAFIHWRELSADGKVIESRWKRIKDTATHDWSVYFSINQYTPGHTYNIKVYDAGGNIKFEKEFK